MNRLVLSILLLLVIVGFGWWILVQDAPLLSSQSLAGHITVEWLGWKITAALLTVALLLISLLVALAVVWRVIGHLARSPGRLRVQLRQRTVRQYQQATLATVAALVLKDSSQAAKLHDKTRRVTLDKKDEAALAQYHAVLSGLIDAGIAGLITVPTTHSGQLALSAQPKQQTKPRARTASQDTYRALSHESLPPEIRMVGVGEQLRAVLEMASESMRGQITLDAMTAEVSPSSAKNDAETNDGGSAASNARADDTGANAVTESLTPLLDTASALLARSVLFPAPLVGTVLRGYHLRGVGQEIATGKGNAGDKNKEALEGGLTLVKKLERQWDTSKGEPLDAIASAFCLYVARGHAIGQGQSAAAETHYRRACLFNPRAFVVWGQALTEQRPAAKGQKQVETLMETLEKQIHQHGIASIALSTWVVLVEQLLALYPSSSELAARLLRMDDGSAEMMHRIALMCQHESIIGVAKQSLQKGIAQ
ncbi:MAG: hypothetical protein K0U36_00500, partial [Alphaproteobacteria bacterium]|nr:hypothetical protein [Alphaproteobacteria bacterium]